MVLIGFCTGKSLLDVAYAQETPFSTIESDLNFTITHGRENPIYVSEGSKRLPVYPPSKISVDFGNVVIKWNLMEVNPDKQPHWIQLSLFKPKSSVTDETILYHPPVGLPNTVRFPPDDDTIPLKEHSEIWQRWIEPYWEPVQGTRVDISPSNHPTEQANTEWPGNRNIAHWNNPSYARENDGERTVFLSPLPLRVASESVHKDGEYFLALLQIKRKGRLRLFWRPMLVKPIIGKGTCLF